MIPSVLKNLQISLPGRYARALFDIAQSENCIEYALSELRAFANGILVNGIKPCDLEQMKDRDFNTFIDDCAKNLKWPDFMSNFLLVLHNERRISNIKRILDIFEQSADVFFNRVAVMVTVSGALNESDRNKLECTISNLLNKEIRFDYAIDPQILGGFKVSVNNSLQVDVSLLSQLNQLQHTLNRIPIKGVG